MVNGEAGGRAVGSGQRAASEQRGTSDLAVDDGRGGEAGPTQWIMEGRAVLAWSGPPFVIQEIHPPVLRSLIARSTVGVGDGKATSK